MSVTKLSKVLTAANQEATLWVDGMSKAGISVRSVTGTPTLKFLGSVDGVQFNPISVGAFPAALSSAEGSLPGTAIQSASAAGSWEVNVQNLKFLRVQMTSGAGPATVVITASIDSSYQEAFDSDAPGVSISGVTFPSTTSSSGQNTMTVPAKTGRTINLTSLEVSMVGPGGHGGAYLRIWSGSVDNGAPLYACHLTPAAGSVGTVQKINLPEDEDRKPGIQAVPGAAMVIQIVNQGALSTVINGRVSYK